MAYSSRMAADRPGLFVFVLNQTAAMAGRFEAGTATLAETVADVLNEMVSEIAARCMKRSRIVHRCDIALIGYGGSGAVSLWRGNLAGQEVVSIRDAVEHPLATHPVPVNVPDGRGATVYTEQTRMIWVQPEARGRSSLAPALHKARMLALEWACHPQHWTSFPPVIIHITADTTPVDIEAALAESQHLKKVETKDGNVLLFTYCLSNQLPDTLLFPADKEELPEVCTRALFEMSSRIPEAMSEMRLGWGPAKQGARAIVFNADFYSMLAPFFYHRPDRAHPC